MHSEVVSLPWGMLLVSQQVFTGLAALFTSAVVGATAAASRVHAQQGPTAAATQLQIAVNDTVTARRPFIRLAPAAGVFEFHASNLVISGADDLVVDGAGATLIFAPANGLQLIGCRRTTLRNLTLDVVPKAFTQGTITSVEPVGAVAGSPVRLTVALDHGYPTLEPAAAWVRAKAILWDSATGRLVDEQGGSRFVSTVEMTSATHGTAVIRPHETNATGWWPVAGQRLTLSATVGLGVLYIDNSGGGLVVEDVTIYGSGNDAIHEYFGAGGTVFRRILVSRRPTVLPGSALAASASGRYLAALPGPLLSTNLGGLVTAVTSRGPQLVDSEFGFMGDDFMWIHTKLAAVWKAEAADGPSGNSTVLLRIVDPEGSKRIASSVGWGSTAQSFDLQTLRNTAELRVHSVVQVTDQTLVAQAGNEVWSAMARLGQKPIAAVTQSWELLDVSATLSTGSKLPSLADLVQSDGGAMTGAVVRNCYFHDGFCNGMRWKSSDSLIEANKIELHNGACLAHILSQPCAPLLCGPIGMRNVTIADNSLLGGCDGRNPIVMHGVTELRESNNSIRGQRERCDACAQPTSTECSG